MQNDLFDRYCVGAEGPPASGCTIKDDVFSSCIYIYIDVDCRSFKAAAAKYKRMHGLEQQQTEAEDRCEHPFLMQC